MPTTLIQQLPTFSKSVIGMDKLAISEMFVNTIQGEGFYTGHPATFIRLQGCTLKCTWCDTLDVWPHGNEYSFQEVIDLLYPYKEKYRNGRQHIVLTGGSPLKQQHALYRFLVELKASFGFRPFIEVENEAVLWPDSQFTSVVDCWNNSPKLSNSGMRKEVRIKPNVIHELSNLPNSWFKFVVCGSNDWNEIVDDYFQHITSRSRIILMPEGQTQTELTTSREVVAELAIEAGVRYCDRLHVVLWNKKTGV